MQTTAFSLALTFANLSSLNRYYVNKNGQVFNHKFEIVKGTFDRVAKIHIFCYKNKVGISKVIPMTRLIYQSYNPYKDILKCTITRKNLKDLYPYNIYNLECNLNITMPIKNGITKIQPKVDNTFYAKFPENQIKLLKEILLNKSKTLQEISRIYNVSEMSICRAKKRLINKEEIIEYKFQKQ